MVSVVGVVVVVVIVCSAACNGETTGDEIGGAFQIEEAASRLHFLGKEAVRRRGRRRRLLGHWVP